MPFLMYKKKWFLTISYKLFSSSLDVLTKCCCIRVFAFSNITQESLGALRAESVPIHSSLSGSADKESACNAGDLGSIPGLGRSPGWRHGSPLQYSCLENPMDRGAWWATVHGARRIGHDWATFTAPSKSQNVCFQESFWWGLYPSSLQRQQVSRELIYLVFLFTCLHLVPHRLYSHQPD